MHLRQAAAVATAALYASLYVLLLPSTADAHNVTLILAKFPEFSKFNHYLTVTQLAPDINRRETITVCAVHDAEMDDLLAKKLTIGVIKDVLSFHVLLDYFDEKKLHQITAGTVLTTTMFQATGSAPGSSGMVNITDLKGGKVGFSPKDNNGNVSEATFVKLIEAIPYNISVIQISSILPSPEAAETPAPAPTPTPSQTNLTAIMAAHGCKVFAETLLTNPAEQTFENNIVSGLTIFCPGDDAMNNFLPKYKNLTADSKQSLLEYHGIPVHQSLSGLRSGNGVIHTLATDGAKNYNFTVQDDGAIVTIKTKIVTAKIINTLFDEQSLVIHKLDKVLIPVELFSSSLSPSPAPAPASKPSAPKPYNSPPAPAFSADSPADAPDGEVADQDADGNGSVKFNGRRLGAVILSIWFVVFLKP